MWPRSLKYPLAMFFRVEFLAFFPLLSLHHATPFRPKIAMLSKHVNQGSSSERKEAESRTSCDPNITGDLQLFLADMILCQCMQQILICRRQEECVSRFVVEPWVVCWRSWRGWNCSLKQAWSVTLNSAFILGVSSMAAVFVDLFYERT